MLVPSFPLPDSSYELDWRELVPEDTRSLADLVERIEVLDNPPYRTTVEEIAELFISAAMQRGIGGFDKDGILRAFAHVRLRESAIFQAICRGGIDPNWRGRGLGKVVVMWHTSLARKALEKVDSSGPSLISVHVEDKDISLIKLLDSLDFTWSRSYYDLSRSLQNIPAPPQLGQYLEIVPWSDDFEDAVRRAHNKLAEDYWGDSPKTMEQWMVGRNYFMPSWSFVALDKSADRAQIAGFLMASRYEQDWDALGWREGYIDLLGVLPQWRETPIANALIAQTMSAISEDEIPRIATGVGSSNHSGILDLYLELGFTVIGQSRMYSITVTKSV